MESYFCVRHKIRWKHKHAVASYFELPFFMSNLCCATKSTIISWNQEQKYFFEIKSKKYIFLYVNNMWAFIYWARHKWQKVDSSFWICRFSRKLSYHSSQQRVSNILFFRRTFVETDSNLMCGSFWLM